VNPMRMQAGNRWRCSNPGCRAEILVIQSSEKVYGAGVRCSCGYRMKRTYEKPVHRKLSLSLSEGSRNGA
jgi:hypothetical protein